MNAAREFSSGGATRATSWLVWFCGWYFPLRGGLLAGAELHLNKGSGCVSFYFVFVSSWVCFSLLVGRVLLLSDPEGLK